ncbi:MAG TPA: flagellin [Xanthobacteraceae bacterium]|nr:flagellin [Xanthobacteraceae bacterium]
MSDIVLSAGVRQNLLSLQKTADQMSITQNRLATGKKVNTALDNPTNFFTSSALQSRAGDFSALLDSMSIGIKTLEAADNGITAITNTIESMQSTLRQARQDRSFQTKSYTIDPTAIGTASLKNISFSGGAVGAIPVNVALNTASVAATPGSSTSGTIPATYTGGTLTINGTNVTIANDSNAATIKSAIDAAGIAGITTSVSGSTITISNANGNVDFTGSTGALLTSLGLSTSTNYAPAVTGAVKTVDQLVAAINTNSSLIGKVTASNDGGKLRIQNLSTTDLTVGGVSGTTNTLDGSASTDSVNGNDVRANLVKQFNELKDQLDKLSDDASFNGINLLRGDKLKITFNENGTSTLVIQAKDINGNPTSISAANLGVSSLVASDVDSDDNIDTLLNGLTDGLGTLRSHASNFGSSLSIVQNRQDFTKAMINTLQTGADNLVLADTNEEAANMLALQTRQQLSQTALSLASQADQAVLRLFG